MDMNWKHRIMLFLIANTTVFIGSILIPWNLIIGTIIALIGISFHVEIILDILTKDNNTEDANPA